MKKKSYSLNETQTQAKICQFFEVMRYVLAGIGFWLASNDYSQGFPVENQVHILFLWVLIPMTGLTGIEGWFLSKGAAEKSGYVLSEYQKQSGMNNLAIAVTAIIVLLLNWSAHVKTALFLVSLLFFSFSSVNHGWTALINKNLNRKQLRRNSLRVLMTIVFVSYSLYLIFPILN